MTQLGVALGFSLGLVKSQDPGKAEAAALFRDSSLGSVGSAFIRKPTASCI